MASGRRAGGDPFNLVVREKKVLAFQFFLSQLGTGKYFAAFTLLREKRIQIGIKRISRSISLSLLYA